MNFLSRLLLFILFFSSSSFATTHDIGITFQASIKTLAGQYPTLTNTTAIIKVLAPNGCILREEEFTGVNITNGFVSFVIGQGSVINSGTPTVGVDPGLTFTQIFDNTTTRTGLICIDDTGATIPGLTSFDPSLSPTDLKRKIRLSLDLNPEIIHVNFNLRSLPYAINSEMLNGKNETDFIQKNSGQGVDQLNVESIFSRYSTLDAIINDATKLSSLLSNVNGSGVYTGAVIGNADTATTAGNVTGVVAIANGGTGGANAIDARANLGLAAIASSGSASDLSTGTVPLARLGSGTADNTKYLRGDGAWSPMGAINFADILNTPTTLAGYGITDSVATSAVVDISHGGTNAITALAARGNLGLGTSSTVDTGSAVGSVPLLGTGGLSANKMCTADGTAAGIICTSTIPTSSQWTSTGSDIYFSTGNVGIGTTTPSAKLDIAEGGSLSIQVGADNGASTRTDATIKQGRIASPHYLNSQNPTAMMSSYNQATANELRIGGGSTDTAATHIEFFTAITNNVASGSERMRIDYNGNVGIGTASPLTTLSVGDGTAVDGGIIALGYGTPGTDGQSLAISGAGTRMIWYPKKAAFRAGHVDGTAWDDSNIGMFSTATGLDTIASGVFSVAMGNSTIASNTFSTAFGGNSTASGVFSTAIGSSTASGQHSTAMGLSTASGQFSTAMGNSTASGQFSTAMGSSIASSARSTAMGLSTASGQYSTAMGYSTSPGYYSTAMGVTNSAAAYSVALGRYNVGGGSDTSWISTDPLFEIGIGASAGSLENAFTVLKNGAVGIGTATPSEKLHVIGNILASGTITPSDLRFKMNIETLNEPLEKIMKIRGVGYYLRKDEFPERGFSDQHQLGVIAQEVEREFPEVVHNDSKGYKAVNYQMLVAPLIESVKALYNKIHNFGEQLQIQSQEISNKADKTEIEKLKNENLELKTRLDRIERTLQEK